MPLTDRETRMKNGFYKRLDKQMMIFFMGTALLPIMFGGGDIQYAGSEYVSQTSYVYFIYWLAVYIVASKTSSPQVMSLITFIIFGILLGVLVDYGEIPEHKRQIARDCTTRMVGGAMIMFVFGIYLSTRMEIMDSKQDKIEDEEIRRRNNDSRRI